MAFETGLAIGIDATPAEQGARRANAAFDSVGRHATDAQRKTSGAFDDLVVRTRRLVAGLQAVAGVTAGLVAGGAFAQLVRQLVSARVEFEKMQASLATVTGGTTQAQQAFKLLQEVAKNTPFSLEEVTQSFIRMKALGLEPTERTIMSFSNTASAMGKTILQFTEAVADAMTGEFERLKEFGIRVRDEGDTLALTFQGQTKTIVDNGKEIFEVLRDIGEVQFGDASARQMATMGGALSNLGDQVDIFTAHLAEWAAKTVGATKSLEGWAYVIGLLDRELFPPLAKQLKEINDEIERQNRLVDEATKNPRGGGIAGTAEANINKLMLERQDVINQLAEESKRGQVIAASEVQKAIAKAEADAAAASAAAAKAAADQQAAYLLGLVKRTIAAREKWEQERIERFEKYEREHSSQVADIHRHTFRKIVDDRIAQHDKMMEDQERREAAALERLRRDGELAQRERERQAELAARPWQNAADAIQRSLADAISNGLDGGIDSAKDFAREFKGIMLTLAAEVAAAMVFRPVVGGITSAAGLPGIGNALTGGSSAGGFGIPGLDVLSGLGGAIDSFGAATGIFSAATAGTSAASAGVATFAGGLTNVAGAGAGLLPFTLSAALPFIGAALGAVGLLTSFLGGNDKPSFGGVVNLKGGTPSLSNITADEGKTNADVQSYAKTILDTFKATIAGLGGSVNGSLKNALSFGFTEGNGFFSGFSGAFQGSPEEGAKAALAELLKNTLKAGVIKGLDADVARVLKAGLKVSLEKALDDAAFVQMLKAKAVDPFTEGAKALVDQFVEMGKRAKELGLPLKLVTDKYQDAVKAYLEGVRQATDAQVAQLRTLAQNIRDTMVDLRFDDRLSPLNPAKRLTEARGLFTSTLRDAKAGDLDAAGRLPDLARLFLTSSRDFNASSVAFGQDFALVDRTLKQFGATLDDQADDASEKTLKNVEGELISMKELLREIKAEATASRRQETTNSADSDAKLDRIGDEIERLNRNLSRRAAGGQ